VAVANSDNRLFIIGNGFDLAHGLPTRFDPDFKEIAAGGESDDRFWDLYQSDEAEIWSDFERLLAKPDFDKLGQIFDAHYPDYTSDRESDRNSSIVQVDISGKLNESLAVFAEEAENDLAIAKPRYLYQNLFTNNYHYVSFNYTHTLENLYNIPSGQVLHIHGEVGGDALMLGYDASSFDVGVISEDVSGHGQYRRTPTKKYIDDIDDYYIRTAYRALLTKIQSWAKPLQTSKLSCFVKGVPIDVIVVIGFSFGKVDAAYFGLLQSLYPNSKFVITAFNKEAASNYKKQITDYYSLNNYEIVLL
jgi:hypothetical protein